MLSGFAGGAFLLSAPAYTSEIAEKKYSGALGTVFQLTEPTAAPVRLHAAPYWRLSRFSHFSRRPLAATIGQEVNRRKPRVESIGQDTSGHSQLLEGLRTEGSSWWLEVVTS